jgi:CDP-diacylglycerol--glycerol-3-phosphate 3-phosphatidyltransferase
MHARIRRQGASPFLGYWPMTATYSLLMPIAKCAASHRVSPNVFSWGCFSIGLASGIAAALGQIALAGALTLSAGCCDALDGMVARLEGIASDAGELLDAAIDRYSEFFFLSGLCIAYRHSILAIVLVQGALMGSLLVSYSQAKAEAMAIPVPSAWMRRPERVSYLGIAALLTLVAPQYPLLVTLTVVGAFANATAARRFFALHSVLRKRLPAPLPSPSPLPNSSTRSEEPDIASDKRSADAAA